jgi:peptide/nickel transport system ATP-binding protein
MSAQPLLQVENLTLDYALPRRSLFGPRPRHRALDDVSLTLARGESLAVVGESGSGKSSLARAVLALERPAAGRVVLLGKDLYGLAPAELRRLRRHAQMVFQDPFGSLDPRRQVGWIVAEPLAALEPGTAVERRERVAEALQSVGLKSGDADRFPHEFSGGQRQRIAIARALITRPDLIVADEAVSALDVSVQAQVLNLFMDLRETLGLGYLFISHDLAVVRQVADRVVVMHDGRIVEEGTVEAVFRAPQHPYTRSLLAAVPRIGVARKRATGQASFGPSE